MRGRNSTDLARGHWGLALTHFESIVSALGYSLAREQASEDLHEPPYNDVVRFLLLATSRMSDFLRPPMVVLTILFNLAGLLHSRRLFHRQSHLSRPRQIQSWRTSRFGFCRDFIKFYEGLAVYVLFARQKPADTLRKFTIHE